MCGIAGALGWIDPEIQAAVETMSAAQLHRGPDAGGTWSSAPMPEGGAVVLAHRRLSIIDLSDEASQPMHDPRTGNALVFNGEIYNFRELRAELERDGARFQTSSDTEVLLLAYAKWGISMVERLRGMFAFALWDAARHELFLARDRVGIKPLYLHTQRSPGRSTLFFASELRSLLAGGVVERKLDPEGLRAYLWNGFVPGPGTIIAGVELMAAGTYRRYGPDGEMREERRFWNLPRVGERKVSREELRATLGQAVSERLVSDVPLGVFLSGGVDSSAIAALASELPGERLKTFNIAFDEGDFDESHYASAVAEALGTDHHEVRLTEERFCDGLVDALAALDQPTFDAINTYFVSRAVRESGMTVALAGTGGDELFGGYRSFSDIPRASRWGRRLATAPEGLVRGMSKAVARLKSGPFGSVPPQTRWGKLGDALSTRGELVNLYQVSYGMYSQEFIRELLRGEEDLLFGLSRRRSQELARMIEGNPTLHSISMLELSSFIGERLLRDTDTASMAVSLEVRVPFLDHEVIEAVAALDETARFQPLGAKQVLRDVACEKLDRGIFDRPKSGFVLPIERWCRERLRGEVESVLHDAARCEAIGLEPDAVERLWDAFQEGAPGIYWSRIWVLYTLMRWCETQEVSL